MERTFLNDPKEVLARLTKDQLYRDWSKNHPENFCSHFFILLDAEFSPKEVWEIGFFADDKITVFVPLKNSFEIKPADDIFRKENEKVEKLELSEVKVSAKAALEKGKVLIAQNFSREQLGDGFLILQTFKGKIIWNFSFITRSLKFVNVKINASTGQEESHEEINLVQK